MHPKAIMVDQIRAYRELAGRFRKAGDKDTAELYDKLANAIKAELFTPAKPPVEPTEKPPGVPREVMPGEGKEPITGLGEV